MDTPEAVKPPTLMSQGSRERAAKFKYRPKHVSVPDATEAGAATSTPATADMFDQSLYHSSLSDGYEPSRLGSASRTGDLAAAAHAAGARLTPTSAPTTTPKPVAQSTEDLTPIAAHGWDRIRNSIRSASTQLRNSNRLLQPLVEGAEEEEMSPRGASVANKVTVKGAPSLPPPGVCCAGTHSGTGSEPTRASRLSRFRQDQATAGSGIPGVERRAG